VPRYRKKGARNAGVPGGFLLPCVAMEVKLKYRGRAITVADIEFMQRLIAVHPEASRRALSKLLCEAWDWRQPNGELRDMVCRSLMLALHRSGFIELPPVRQRPRNNVVERQRPKRVEVDERRLRVSLSALRPLTFRQVRRTGEEKLFNALVAEHHYLGYRSPVGEHLKYLVYSSEERPIACFGWCSPARRLAPRDRFIGWSKEARAQNAHFIAYNSRFLILPWVEVRQLASHLLSRMARVLVRDWESVYGHEIHYLETFVDPERFRGTCYRAANWISLGLTTGRGKDDQQNKPNRTLKEVLGYPLSGRFREILGEV